MRNKLFILGIAIMLIFVGCVTIPKEDTAAEVTIPDENKVVAKEEATLPKTGFMPLARETQYKCPDGTVVKSVKECNFTIQPATENFETIVPEDAVNIGEFILLGEEMQSILPKAIKDGENSDEWIFSMEINKEKQYMFTDIQGKAFALRNVIGVTQSAEEALKQIENLTEGCISLTKPQTVSAAIASTNCNRIEKNVIGDYATAGKITMLAERGKATKVNAKVIGYTVGNIYVYWFDYTQGGNLIDLSFIKALARKQAEQIKNSKYVGRTKMHVAEGLKRLMAMEKGIPYEAYSDYYIELRKKGQRMSEILSTITNNLDRFDYISCEDQKALIKEFYEIAAKYDAALGKDESNSIIASERKFMNDFEDTSKEYCRG